MQVILGSNSEYLSLGDVCTNIGNNKRNNFNILDKDDVQPVKIQVHVCCDEILVVSVVLLEIMVMALSNVCGAIDLIKLNLIS